MPDSAVIVFLKSPEAGRVKTRLAQDLDQDLVLDLYRSFVLDTLEIVGKIVLPTVFFTPPHQLDRVRDWLGHRYDYIAQEGGDLGQRMANAFQTVFEKGISRALLVGTDIPELSESVLKNALEQLAANGVVIGPSSDGGYYLIGCRKDSFTPAIFQDIDWSTDRVLEQTLASEKQNLLSVGLMDTLHDIDTANDLDHLVSRIESGHVVGRRTQQILSQYSSGSRIKPGIGGA